MAAPANSTQPALVPDDTTTAASPPTMPIMFVVKRDGKHEEVSFDKVIKMMDDMVVLLGDRLDDAEAQAEVSIDQLVLHRASRSVGADADATPTGQRAPERTPAQHFGSADCRRGHFLGRQG